MATIVLQAAGAFLGGIFGPIGSALGAAAGAMAGYAVDRTLIEGSRRIEGPRLGSMRPFQAEEGVPIPRVYGTARIGGNLIWATRFEEKRHTERPGAKGGGPKVTTYSYFCNVAFALCEGEIAGVRRIWADGREMDLEQVTVRVYRGSQDQPVDPLIEAKQGAGKAPAYRGVAYVVFERLPLGEYGNRIPQLQFEVMRPVGRLHREIRSVVLLPGSTEYGLLPRAVTRKPRAGETLQVNRNVLHARSDLVASLDELQALCPNLEEVAVVVAWFGSDLRAGACRIRPTVVHNSATGHSEPWSVSGLTRATAPTVSYVDGAASFGGTPSDRSVVECIREIKSRGLRATLYPFVMMDIPPENGLPNPYGGSEQPAFPWRGRITCNPAPTRSGTADKTAAARDQVAAFCGAAQPAQFGISGDRVTYSGSASDWGYRRLILHYAHLAVAAGGVHGFLLGSEMRGLTTLRDHTGGFPFVDALCDLAGEVRSVLGSSAISYGADWSEYFGHQPADGSGDAIFHLDKLWAHDAISAVGIDNYMPLSDWRDGDRGGGNPDGFAEPYDAEALRGQIAAGEGFDWYYAGDEARASRQRTPITDGAYGKPWTYRSKDLVSWWGNPHFDRIGGVERATPTAWQHRSKPLWFTELGCPAVDKGPNQPNVFPDARSSENAVPHFSSGGRSDLAQHRFLRAHMEHWLPGGLHFDPAANPVSPVYGGRMVPARRIYLWAWDARPFPAFPSRQDEWSDGQNWNRGHWLNGRLSTVMNCDLIETILADHGLAGDVTRVGGSVAGYVIEAPTTARAALEPLTALHGICVHEENGVLTFKDEGVQAGEPVTIDEMVVPETGATIEKTRIGTAELPHQAELTFLNPFRDYQAAVARATWPDAEHALAYAVNFPGCLEEGAAAATLDDWLRRRWIGRDTVSFAVPATRADVAPGSIVKLASDAAGADYLVTDVETGLTRQVSARRIARSVPSPWQPGSHVGSRAPAIAGMPLALLLDLPSMPGGGAEDDQFRLAAYGRPWKAQVAFASPEETGFAQKAIALSPATIGELVAPAGRGPEGRFDHAGALVVALHGGALASVSDAQLLNGANTAAVLCDNGVWEIVQFGTAEEIAPSTWRLTRLLRAQLGTGDAMASGAGAGAPFVLLDEAVERAGLTPEQAGLALNWRIGPAGQDFGGDSFAQLTAAGGIRARLPLSPVHLRLRRMPNGDAAVSWIRRGRVNADSWLAEDIPLGEEAERYRVEIRSAGGSTIRSADVPEASWIYRAADIAADLPALPAEIEIAVSQLSATVGAGLPSRKSFVIG